MKKILFILLFVQNLFATELWQPKEVLNDAWVNDFICYPNNNNHLIFLAVNAGIFRSTNFGGNWFNSTFIKIGDSLNDYYGKFEFVRLAKTSDAVLASIKGGSLVISYDDGQTWKVIEAKELGDIKSMYVCNDDKIYAGSDKGLFISIDNGFNWKKAITGFNLNDSEINEIKSDNNGNIYFCMIDSILELDKIKDSFRILKVDLKEKLSINSISFINNFIYLAADNGLYVSKNNGSNWEKMNNILTGKKITTVESVFGYFFAGTEHSSLYITQDTFKTFGHWINNLKIGRLKVFPNSLTSLYVLGFGLFNDNDQAKFFTGRCFGLGFSKLSNVFFNKENFMYYSTEGNIYDSHSRNIWYSRTNDLPLKINTLFFGQDKASNLYYSDLNYPLYRVPMSDYYYNWKVPDSSLVSVWDMLFTKDGSLFALNLDGNVFLSKSDGAKWVKLDFSDSVKFIALNRNDEVLAVSENKLFLSVDAGNSWSSYNNNIRSFTSDSINTYKIIDSTIIAATQKGILFTIDYGLTWSSASDVPQININNIVCASSELYASSDSGIIRSLDFGRTWSDFNNGLPRIKKCKVLNVDNDGYVFVATEFYGLYKSIQPVNEVKESAIINNNLLTLSPNPATDFLEISFSPSINHRVNPMVDYQGVAIYNVFGEKVINLTPTLSIHGEGVKLNVSDLPSGVYFVKAGGEVGKFVKI